MHSLYGWYMLACQAGAWLHMYIVGTRTSAWTGLCSLVNVRNVGVKAVAAACGAELHLA